MHGIAVVVARADRMRRQGRADRVRQSLAQRHGLGREAQRRGTEQRRAVSVGQFGDGLGVGHRLGKWFVDERRQAGFQRRAWPGAVARGIAGQDQHGVDIRDGIFQRRAHALDQARLGDAPRQLRVRVEAGDHPHVPCDRWRAAGGKILHTCSMLFVRKSCGS